MTDREKLIELLRVRYRASNPRDLIEYRLPNELVEKIADHLIANGVTIQQWVPVAERLPEIGVNILVCHKNGYVTRNAWLSTRWLFKNKTNPVTHWMLMPQPLKGE